MAVLIASPLFITSYRTVWFFNRNGKTEPEKYSSINLDLTSGSTRSFRKAQDLDYWYTPKDTECTGAQKLTLVKSRQVC